MKFITVCASVDIMKGEWVGSTRLFLTLSLSAASPILSSLLSSPLHWWREPCVGVAQETSSWTTSLECCLRSVLELILITPPLPPTTTQQPFHLHAAADNVKRSSKEVIYRLRCAHDHTLQTGNTTLLFSPSKSFCSKGFTVQTTYQDVIVPNNCWRSWPFSHPSPFLCPVLFHPVSLLSSHHITSTEEVSVCLHRS